MVFSRAEHGSPTREVNPWGGHLLDKKGPPYIEVDMKTSEKIKRLRKKCDTLWSECVRTRDGECVLCGKKEGLNAHHWIHSRAQGNMHRWDVKNGITLCMPCHRYKVHTYASADIIERLKDEAFARGIVTPQEYEEIADNHTIAKFGVEDYEHIKDYLQAYLESLDANFYAVGGTDDL